MIEGAISLVLDIPRPWPPERDVEFARRKSGVSIVSLSATRSKNFVLTVSEDGSRILHFTSQPVAFTGRGVVIVIASWKDGTAEISLNNVPLLPSQEGLNSEVVVKTKRAPVDSIPSVHRPDAADHCKKWMAWRKSRYYSPKLHAKKNRRLKTLEEQEGELRHAILSLADLSSLFQQGRTHLMGHLAVELRALLYWNGKNYNPLLLRIAGRHSLPLPVHALQHEGIDEPDIVQKARQDIRLNEASILKSIPRQELVDVQEWLQRPVQKAALFRHRDGRTASENDTLSAKDVILETATILGDAHYDDDLPDSLELLHDTLVAGSSALNHFILQTALMVVALGKYVLGPPPQNPPNNAL